LIHKYHLEDPPREKIHSIEKSPQDYYPQIREIEDCPKPMDIDDVWRDKESEKEKNEKNASKIIKKKPKKIPSKSNKSAMASI
jgi:hypothetical protein